MFKLEDAIARATSWDELILSLRRSGAVIHAGDDECPLVVLSWDYDKEYDDFLHRDCGLGPVLYMGYNIDRCVISRRGTIRLVAVGLSIIHYNDYCLITDAIFAREEIHAVKAYDGRIVSRFCYEGKWWYWCETSLSLDRMPSFRCPSHTLAMCISDAEVKQQDEEVLREECVYVYQLLHHKDRRVITYADTFGDAAYAKLIHIATRDMRTMALEASSAQTVDEGIGIMDEYNRKEIALQNISMLKDAGVWVLTGRRVILLHTAGIGVYARTTGPEWVPGSNLHMISLYQANNMDCYFDKFRDDLHVDGFNVKNMIDCVFKVLTSEILNIFKNHVHEIEKNTIPPHYLNLLQVISCGKNPTVVNMRTVYEALKRTEPSTILTLLREREVMIRSNTLGKFLSTGGQSDHLMATAVSYLLQA